MAIVLTGRKADYPVELGRDHPWTFSMSNPDWKYYDLKSSPCLIRTVLEDFRPFDNTDAVERFYEFLEWLNGEESCLESNDCGLRPLQDNLDRQFNKRRRILGRVMVLFRRQEINCQAQTFNWLMGCFEFHLRRVRPNFMWGAIELARFPTRFTNRGCTGHVLEMTFYSYGDNDDEVFQNLEATISGIQMATFKVNCQIQESNLY